MRKFERAGEPAVLKENADKWNNQWTERCKAAPNASFAWYVCDGRSAKYHILPTLREQTQGHCSFCDAFPVGGVSYETVEHFKPKTQFPENAYTWTNLYYCCDSCQGAKRELWDELLLRPDASDYHFSDYFEFDYTTGEIRPNQLVSEGQKHRAAITITIYGLDGSFRRRNRLLEARRWSRSGEVKPPIDEYAYRDFLGDA